MATRLLAGLAAMRNAPRTPPQMIESCHQGIVVLGDAAQHLADAPPNLPSVSLRQSAR